MLARSRRRSAAGRVTVDVALKPGSITEKACEADRTTRLRRLAAATARADSAVSAPCTAKSFALVTTTARRPPASRLERSASVTSVRSPNAAAGPPGWPERRRSGGATAAGGAPGGPGRARPGRGRRGRELAALPFDGADVGPVAAVGRAPDGLPAAAARAGRSPARRRTRRRSPGCQAGGDGPGRAAVVLQRPELRVAAERRSGDGAASRAAIVPTRFRSPTATCALPRRRRRARCTRSCSTPGRSARFRRRRSSCAGWSPPCGPLLS